MQNSGQCVSDQYQYYKNEYRSCLLCIDSYDNKDLVGRLYNPCLENGISFANAIQFILAAESLFDRMDIPQPFMSRHSIWEDKIREVMLPESPLREEAQHTGRRATFLLRIVFRQNASWQGNITWLEQNKNECFRSILELIKILDAAL